MKDKLLIDGHTGMTVIAMIQENKLHEVYCESENNNDIVGNIYLGKVINVAHSLSAYFVDYGSSKNGFLSFSGTLTQLKRDDLVIVQVIKNQRDNKGARLSCFIKLSGKHVFFFPYTRGSDGEMRYNSIVMKHKRSNSHYAPIKHDLEHLEILWKEILATSKVVKSPQILHQEHSLIHRILRDRYHDTQLEIIIDGYHRYMQVKQIVNELQLSHSVKEHKSIVPVFSKFGVADEFTKLADRSVSLSSGGSIVIDTTEAMTCVDINSSSCNRSDLAETALKVNLEAAEEVANQIRLRDLSGIIAIDFIDMHGTNDNSQVEAAFRSAMQNDTALSKIANINDFGVLMISRQRIGLNLHQQVYTKCNSCIGHGFIKTTSMLAFEMLSEIRLSIHSNPGELIKVECSENASNYMLNEMRQKIASLERNGTRINISTNRAYCNEFTVHPKGELKDSEISKFIHPVVEKASITPRFMQDLNFSPQYIVQDGGMMIIDVWQP